MSCRHTIGRFPEFKIKIKILIFEEKKSFSDRSRPIALSLKMDLKKKVFP
jgi:hypothetical protein